MKKRSIILFPEFENMESINNIRKKYDPLANCISPHITLVFPFNSNISTEELRKHIIEKISKIKDFRVKLKGVISEENNYLFLDVVKGKNKIRKIHDLLYTELLEGFLAKDIPYNPHITIGKFKSREKLIEAKSKIQLNETFETKIEKVFVETILEDDSSKIELEVELKWNK